MDFLEVLDECQLVSVNAIWIMDESRRVGHRDYFSAEVMRFLCRIDRNVARTGNRNGLSSHAVTDVFEHVFAEIDTAIAGRFSTDQTTSELQAFPRQRSHESVGKALVLSEQETDFSTPNADVSGRNVCIFTNMAM